jgi:hypothetical protein
MPGRLQISLQHSCPPTPDPKYAIKHMEDAIYRAWEIL